MRFVRVCGENQGGEFVRGEVSDGEEMTGASGGVGAEEEVACAGGAKEAGGEGGSGHGAGIAAL